MTIPITLPIIGGSAACIYVCIRPKFENGTYLVDEISIPKDPLGMKKPVSKNRGRGEEGAPSVPTA